ncbi:MAG TPA: hypothetical protein VJQ45_11760 [Ktedonobacterales bacterium]|nr:hypothetical protein [Ktedonobacterales bacterium]
MPIGATISAVGAVGGAAIGSSAAKSAAKTQANSATQAAQLQSNMFNTIRSDLSPYRAAGTAGLGAVYQLLGLTPPTVDNSTVNLLGAGSGASSTVLTDAQAQQLLNDRPDVLASYQQGMKTADPHSPHSAAVGLAGNPLDYARYWFSHMGGSSAYQVPGTEASATGGVSTSPLARASGTSSIGDFLSQTPGYQFQLQQGTQAVNNALAARGLGGLSGSLGKGLAKYVTGLADSTYQQQLANYMGLATMGQTAANQTSGYGSTAATNAGTALTNAGTAAASGQVGSANAWGGALGNLGNTYLTSQLLNSGMYGGSGAGVGEAAQVAQGISGGWLGGE